MSLKAVANLKEITVILAPHARPGIEASGPGHLQAKSWESFGCGVGGLKHKMNW